MKMKLWDKNCGREKNSKPDNKAVLYSTENWKVYELVTVEEEICQQNLLLAEMFPPFN